MSAQSLSTPPRHLPYLDSARGLAALMVLFGHFYSWKYSHVPAVKYLDFIFNAVDAVSFFFVLSGMVLTYQYVVLGNSLDLRKYTINRFFRLFPAFFLTVVLHTVSGVRQTGIIHTYVQTCSAAFLPVSYGREGNLFLKGTECGRFHRRRRSVVVGAQAQPTNNIVRKKRCWWADALCPRLTPTMAFTKS
jgi:hypothetical protein